MRRRRALAAALLGSLPGVASSLSLPTSERATRAAARVLPELRVALAPLGLQPGHPVYLRIFKREAVLELWLQPAAGQPCQLFQAFPICAYSGQLGPKTREGDLQAPEGIYSVAPRQLNPHSSYHLSFNLGYPNAYEQAQGWTGSALMVHGSCVSIGCYAMTDAGIERIYTLVAAALSAGQGSVPVHAFPFRLEAEALTAEQDSPWFAHWQMLAPVYQAFERDRRVPKVRVGRAGYELAP